MNRQELIALIQQKKSFLCVGLDTDINKLPSTLPRTAQGVLSFNKSIIEATHEVAVAFKVNTAFYEAMGKVGWEVMEETLKFIPNSIFTIADAKRGDIGNTSGLYARAFFEQLSFDALTVSPYMGHDSVGPFLNYPDKWTILLALTSNAGSADFQTLNTPQKMLYQQVLQTAQNWGSPNNLMFVVGATKAAALSEIRKIVPHHFLLVPGVGAQGGSLSEVFQHGANQDIGLLVNASRSILYAAQDEGFAKAAANEAYKMASEMKALMEAAFNS